MENLGIQSDRPGARSISYFGTYASSERPRKRLGRAFKLICFLASMAMELGFCALCLGCSRPEDKRNNCIANLEAISNAKAQVIAKYGLPNGSVVSEQMLTSCGLRKWPLRCPGGGTYTVNPIGKEPTCSSPSHAIPAGN